MVNFILKPDNSGIIESSLRQCAPEFFDSDEYKSLVGLDPKLTQLPGLLCGRFTSFFCRLLEEKKVDSETQAYFDLVESWVRSDDSAVLNYVITEVFENVRLPGLGVSYFKSRLGPRARELYEEWMEYPPEDRLNVNSRS